MQQFHGRKRVWLIILALTVIMSISSCRCRNRQPNPPQPQIHPAAINPETSLEMREKCTSTCKNYCLSMKQCKGEEFKTALCGNVCLWACTRDRDQEVQKCAGLGGDCQALQACTDDLAKIVKQMRQEQAPKKESGEPAATATPAPAE